MHMNKLEHVFVRTIPDVLDEKSLYISLDYNTAVHSCACGCGEEVVTPLSKKDWKLIYDGESVSLSPSIGNWSYSCRSHYWIKENTVKWAESWSEEKVRSVRAEENSKINNSKGFFSILKRIFK